MSNSICVSFPCVVDTLLTSHSVPWATHHTACCLGERLMSGSASSWRAAGCLQLWRCSSSSPPASAALTAPRWSTTSTLFTMSTTEVRLGFLLFWCHYLPLLLCELQNFVEVVSGDLGQIHVCFWLSMVSSVTCSYFLLFLFPLGFIVRYYYYYVKCFDPLLLFTIRYYSVTLHSKWWGRKSSEGKDIFFNSLC